MRVRRFAIVASFVFAAPLVACGGTSDQDRVVGPTTPNLELDDTFGGRPARCEQDDDVEVLLIEDFETGRATGWYVSNDICKACNDIDGNVADLKRPLGCLKENVLAWLGQQDDALEAELAQKTSDVRVPTDCDARQVLEATDGNTSRSDSEVQQDAIELFQRLVEEREMWLEEWDNCGIEECAASQTPFIFDKPLPAEQVINGPRCDSYWAMHIKTYTPLRDFGGNFGRSFSSKLPMDLRDYDGVSFWARTGPNGRNLLKVNIPERHTDETVLIDGEPACLFETQEDDTTQGCDKHGTWVSLTEDWEFYTLPFSEMRQAGWGKPAPFFDISAVVGVTFEYQAGEWDLWFDDIGFYRKVN